MNQSIDRRTFIAGVGVAVLTAQLVPLIACTSGMAPSDGDGEADNLIIHSGPGVVPHAHDLLIPQTVLNAPPAQGVKLASTRALFHTHEIVLTREQLVTVQQGGTVTQVGGSHLFVIELADRRELPSETKEKS